MKEAEVGPPNKELYALLHISPEASDEEIRKAYRQWAQVYHPDKYQSPQMKDIATENFQRICEAYEILSDERKRQIYDIYGMEGLTSGLELGPKLNKAEEIKEELERLRRRKEMEKVSAHVQPSGSILANLSLPQFLKGGSIMRGMAMSSELQSQISKRNAIAIGGNLAVNGNAGGGAASVMLRHQISSVSSIEFMASTGLRALIGVQTSRNLSLHSTATMGITMSLRDGSINLSNSWTRQLSDTSSGNIQLVLGPESSVAVGWQKKEEKMSAAGEIKIGTSSFGASAHYTHRFSTKSHGRIAGRVGSTMLELEVGGGRKISQFSTVRMLYSVGIQGIFWKFELHRGRQKLIVPILLSRHLNAVFATGAFVIPTSLYFFLKTFIIKPYYLKREKQKMLENMEKTSTQVQEARAAAEKAQQLLQNVANRKRSRQLETDGLVITKAVYGSKKSLNKKRDEAAEANDELASQVIDVTLPLNFHETPLQIPIQSLVSTLIRSPPKPYPPNLPSTSNLHHQIHPKKKPMSFEEEEESFEHTLLVVREVAVYKIPPRTTSSGYKCGEWLQSDKIWSGRLRVVSCKDRCEIRLEDPSSGELFAACFVLPGQRDTSVEPVLDSSRYFVLKIEDGRGKHAFIGLGFNERNEAFDFNVALSDHDKYVKREHDKEAGESSDGSDDNYIDIHPAVNHRLKEGETIRITVKNKPSSGTGMLSAAGLSGGVSGTGKPKALSLAPPPTGATKIRSPLPPPPNDPAAVRITSTSHGVGLKGPKENARHSTDTLSDFSQLERNLPSTTGSGSAKTSAAGWAAF